MESEYQQQLLSAENLLDLFRASISQALSTGNTSEAQKIRQELSQKIEYLRSNSPQTKLMQLEKRDWESLLKKEVTVPLPPFDLFKTLKQTKKQGLDIFTPYFIPEISFRDNTELVDFFSGPGNPWIGLKNYTLDHISYLQITKPKWILLDTTSYNQAKNYYWDDKLPAYLNKPHFNRIGTYAETLHKLEKLSNLSNLNMTLPNIYDLTLLNLHRKLKNSSFIEWISTPFVSPHASALNYNPTTFPAQRFRVHTSNYLDTGFRPVIEFTA